MSNDDSAGTFVTKCLVDFGAARFRCEEEFLRRFVAALLAKPFVILTGLAGSGKTKLAQAFARWSTPVVNGSDPFLPGAPLINSYRVMAADRLAIEFWNKGDEKVVLPRALIEEWAEFLAKNPAFAEMPSKEIREKFIQDYEARTGPKFAKHAIFWDSHLKPAALALIESRKTAGSSCRCYEIVSVGADWTSSEQVLGYADGLDKSRYIRTRALDLILRAVAAPEVPHFLILDEMNLSHVERYFADLLSALESGEPVHLHSAQGPAGGLAVLDGVPGEIRLPPNLFIVGTVNVDETTYMFSPKVLDRSNVLEFRVSSTGIKEFLENPAGVDLTELDGRGVEYGRRLIDWARSAFSLPDSERGMLAAELCLFFDVLQSTNAEFGFRLAKEAASFVHFHRMLSGTNWEFRDAMDAQILQKLLPKLHGSRNVLEPILCALAILCFAPRNWEYDSSLKEFAYLRGLRAEARKARLMEDESLDPLGLNPTGGALYPIGDAHYSLSFGKILRMLERLRTNGFTSFAEA